MDDDDVFEDVDEDGEPTDDGESEPALAHGDDSWRPFEVRSPNWQGPFEIVMQRLGALIGDQQGERVLAFTGDLVLAQRLCQMLNTGPRFERIHFFYRAVQSATTRRIDG